MKVAPKLHQHAERTAKDAKALQATANGLRSKVQVLESTLAVQKAMLDAELTKATPDLKVVKGVKESIGKLTDSLGTARKELKAALAEASSATSTASTVAAESIKENKKI